MILGPSGNVHDPKTFGSAELLKVIQENMPIKVFINIVGTSQKNANLEKTRARNIRDLKNEINIFQITPE